MATQHLVRVGALGHVGRFTAVDMARYPRHARVILRTGRGLEIGEVLASPSDSLNDGQADGSILRGMTLEDELVESRLEKNRLSALNACSDRISELDVTATLMDVEHLFDGRTLLFYFLGDVTPELEKVTGELAELYEAEAQFRRFTEAVNEGCGPGCGTENAEGGGCQSCDTGCAIAGACGVRRN